MGVARHPRRIGRSLVGSTRASLCSSPPTSDAAFLWPIMPLLTAWVKDASVRCVPAAISKIGRLMNATYRAGALAAVAIGAYSVVVETSLGP